MYIYIYIYIYVHLRKRTYPHIKFCSSAAPIPKLNTVCIYVIPKFSSSSP